jgi:RNA polymerase sigma-70 factor, ECF subfamily
MVPQIVLRTQPDGKLVTLARAGSEPAFEAIVHRYRRPLLGYCRRLRLSDNRSEDVVQQAFLSAWTSLRGGTEVRELRPWLYRITHNQVATTLRGQGSELAPLGDASLAVAGAEDAYERQARLQDTLAALAALPASQRDALLATAIDGLSYDETAVALGISSDAVRGLVHRARHALRVSVAALVPPPLVFGAAGLAPRAGRLVAWLSGSAGAGGGAAGLVKGAAVLGASAAVVTGAVAPTIESKRANVPIATRHGVKHAAKATSRAHEPRPGSGATARGTGRPASTAALSASASGSGSGSASGSASGRTAFSGARTPVARQTSTANSPATTSTTPATAVKVSLQLVSHSATGATTVKSSGSDSSTQSATSEPSSSQQPASQQSASQPSASTTGTAPSRRPPATAQAAEPPMMTPESAITQPGSSWPPPPSPS